MDQGEKKQGITQRGLRGGSGWAYTVGAET